jgi:argininosuccinate synthase
MRIVLAYSGGLDTSVALRWLKERYDAEIIAFCADIGQSEDLRQIEAKAYATGAAKVFLEDMREEFLVDFCFPALRAGAAYENQYLLAAPLGRPLIAKRMVEIARAEDANAVAHGATGKGNDQVRFYSSVIALDPDMQVLSPVIDWEMKSRAEEIAYAIEHDIPVPVSQAKPYSIDTNIWGSSIECGPLDDIALSPPEDVYQLTVSPEKAPDEPINLVLEFEQGTPTSLDGERCGAVELITRLNELGGAHAVGRIDILENRVVGIKTRGIYESPAATILHVAHREIENLVLDRDTLHFKAMIAQKYSELVYYGLWFSPLREALEAFIAETQKRVTGNIELRLYKSGINVVSRSSPNSMYDLDFSTYEHGDIFDHSSGKGFSYVWSMPLRLAYQAATGSSRTPRKGGQK